MLIECIVDFVAHRTRSKARLVGNGLLMRAANLAGGANEPSIEALLARACVTTADPILRDHQQLEFDTFIQDDPLSYEAAIASTDAEKWKDSMRQEWNSILENQTFKAFEEGGELTPIGCDLPGTTGTPLSYPATAKPISSKWVYKTKRNPDGSVRFKSRLVIRGFQQVEGVDYGDTYAPVSKLTTFRLLISLAAQYGWVVDHLDVVTAFLNPKIDREHVYMVLPPGLEWLDPRFSPSGIVLLLKALYGLKQAPRLWYDEINRFLLSIGLRQSPTDPNLYVGSGVLLLLYVDDIILVHTSPNGGEPTKRQLLEKYKMTDLGKACRLLGVEIYQGIEGISLCQGDYIRKVLRRFGMQGCHGVHSPMDPNVCLNNEKCEDKRVPDHKQYLSMVGSLMYAALGTRPDLSYCVTALSRYNATPLQMHLTAAKRALRYLKQTADHRLFYPRAPELADGLAAEAVIHGFTDSDWAGNEFTRKSVGGCIFYTQVTPGVGRLGGPGCYPGPGAVHWQSRTQTVVALSTLEAEYIACSDAVREAIWVRRLLADIIKEVFPESIGAALSTAVRIGCDN